MKVELMRYKNDSLSFYMNILAIAFNVVFLICIMANLSITADWIIGVDVLVNILFMLFAFLTAEKVKAYLPKWCCLSLVLAAVQIVRIFTIVIPFSGKGELTGVSMILSYVALVGSVAALVVGFITSFIRSKKLGKYLEGVEAGTVKDSIVDGEALAGAEEEVMLTVDDVENG